MRFVAFNGDCDGLCALQQLYLHEGTQILVTGVKRHIDLVKDLEAGPEDEVTVLDVSFDVNRAAVLRLLERGTRVRYFDHHHAGELPSHARLQAFIDTSPKVCTSVLVDRYLRGAHKAWAVVGAFGDNLDETARALAAELSLPEMKVAVLRELGIALNYNAYGETTDDLHFPPAELHARLRPYEHPLDFARQDVAFAQLRDGYNADLALGLQVKPHAESPHAALYVLPDEKWARRVSGVLASRLARNNPSKACAVLLPTKDGLQVSVRAPLERPHGAAALCREFPTGGGREGAAGINQLPAADLERFSQRFIQHFSVIARPLTLEAAKRMLD
jgi:hypothetical protein